MASALGKGCVFGFALCNILSKYCHTTLDNTVYSEVDAAIVTKLFPLTREHFARTKKTKLWLTHFEIHRGCSEI